MNSEEHRKTGGISEKASRKLYGHMTMKYNYKTAKRRFGPPQTVMEKIFWSKIPFSHGSREKSSFFTSFLEGFYETVNRQRGKNLLE